MTTGERFPLRGLVACLNMIADLTRTLIHGRPSPVTRDDALAHRLSERFGGSWDIWADHTTKGEVRVYIAGPGGTAVVHGTWLDALDLDAWERRQLDAARSIRRSPKPSR